MRKVTVVAAVALVFAAAFPPAAAQAAQVGLYGTVGAGVADWEQDSYHRYADEERDTTHTGFGLVFDVPAQRNFFGYRLGVGYERIDHDPVYGLSGFDMRGVVIDQDLTFSFSPPPMRFWLGPEVRLAFLRAESDAVSGHDIDYFGLGIGPVFGLDMAIGPGLALAWKAGYLITAYAGEDRDSSAYDDENSFAEGHGFLTLSILFRTWGGYQDPGPAR